MKSGLTGNWLACQLAKTALIAEPAISSVLGGSLLPERASSISMPGMLFRIIVSDTGRLPGYHQKYRPMLQFEEGLYAGGLKAALFFSFDTDLTRRVKASHANRTWQDLAFRPAVILLIALPESDDKTDPG